MRKRNNVLSVRLSDDERKLLQQKVEACGQTIQSYIINSSLTGRVSTAEEINELRSISETLKDIDKQLRGMGINLNQMAYIANSIGKIPALYELNTISSEVQLIKKEVIQLWQLIRQSISQQNLMVP